MESPHMTPRQRQALLSMATGVTRKEAAWRLGISQKTLEHHLDAVYAALDVGGLVGAFRALDWIRPPTDFGTLPPAKTLSPERVDHA